MKNILFVCTGNTCRSPMAEAIFNHFAPEGYSAFSAGIYASDGKAISDNSIAALAEIGISASHTSVKINEQLMSKYDYIVGITSEHAKILTGLYPEFAKKIYSFPREVSDPYGMDLDAYRKCRDLIYDGICDIIKEICK